LFDLMHTAWIQNPSNTKYEDDQPFPSDDGLKLISKLSSSWPMYDLQISFIDDQLSVYSHIDLSAGFNLLNSNLPLAVKTHFEKWKLERETGVEDAGEASQFFSWLDSVIS